MISFGSIFLLFSCERNRGKSRSPRPLPHLLMTVLGPIPGGRVGGSPGYSSFLGKTNFSNISLQNLANCFHEKQTVGSAGRGTRLPGSPFSAGKVTLLAGPAFLT